MKICVFCGARDGAVNLIIEEAKRLGEGIGRKGWGLVYGGGHVGLMGRIADSTLAAGGEVVGVIPQSLVDRELAHAKITQLHVTNSMHERKALMANLSDAFVAFPGGFGTLDELCEIVTWAQLGIHSKPIHLVNVGGYFDSFLEFLRRGVRDGFLDDASLALLQVSTSAAEVLAAMEKNA